MTIHRTAEGTPYLTGPTVIPLSWPATLAGSMVERRRFQDEFLAPLGFGDDYFEEPQARVLPTEQAAHVAKLAGQLCYMSFGPKRTKWSDRERYFTNLVEQGHESVFEHAHFSFLFFGISRSCTHELVRHRHLGYSQLSQRYVNGEMLRFVERPEFAASPVLHDRFMARCDRTRVEYEEIAAQLMEEKLARIQNGDEPDQKVTQTEKRKAVNQAARAILPNETEAPIVVSGNLRALRGVLKLRRSKHAEPEIRALSNLLFAEVKAMAPEFFPDFKE